MFRLKMAKKPKLFKLKFNFIFPQIVLANMQEKEITPTKEIQIVEPDRNYDGLSKVIVDKIPDEYIIPQGNLEIIQNGTYDVTNYASANVNVPTKTLGTKTITSNGIYKAIDDNLDGYSEVEVATSGVDINEYFNDTISSGTQSIETSGWAQCVKKFKSPLTISGNKADYMFYNYPFEKTPTLNGTENLTQSRWMFYYCYASEIDLSNFNTSNITWMNSMFERCQKITSLDVSNFDTSKVTTMVGMFYGCVKLTSLDVSNFDTSNVIYMTEMFRACSSLTSLDISSFNTSNVTDMGAMFYGCSSLTNLNISNFDFTNVTTYTSMFQNVPSNCYILVKDATAKNWITSKYTNLTNVHYVGEEG